MKSTYKQGGTSSLIKIAYRNIWRNKRRTSFILVALGVSTFFFLILMSMQDGIIKNMNDTVQIFESGHIKVVSVQYEAEKESMPVQYPVGSSVSQPDGKNWRELAASIHGIYGVRAVFPRITVMATLQESTIKHSILWGIDIEAETAAHHLNLTNRNNGLVEGRYPSPDTNECAIGTVFARKAGLSIGDRIPFKTVSAQFSDRHWSPVITGIFNFDYPMYDERAIIIDFQRLQRLLTLYEGTQQLVIFANDESRSPFIAAEVQNLLGKDSAVTDWNDNYWIVGQKMNNVVYMVVYLVFLIVASFMIINTVVMIIHERIKEIGMMGCLGMTRTEIAKVFFFESFFLAAIGALCGVIIGGTLSGILSIFPIRLGDLYGNMLIEAPVSGTVFFRFSLVRIIQTWLIGVAVTTILTLIPSLKSAFVEPVEALKK